MTALALDVRELSVDETDAVAGGPLFVLVIPALAVKAAKFTALAAGAAGLSAALTVGANAVIEEIAD